MEQRRAQAYRFRFRSSSHATSTASSAMATSCCMNDDAVFDTNSNVDHWFDSADTRRKRSAGADPYAQSSVASSSARAVVGFDFGWRKFPRWRDSSYGLSLSRNSARVLSVHSSRDHLKGWEFNRSALRNYIHRRTYHISSGSFPYRISPARLILFAFRRRSRRSRAKMELNIGLRKNIKFRSLRCVYFHHTWHFVMSVHVVARRQLRRFITTMKGIMRLHQQLLARTLSVNSIAKARAARTI